MSFGGRSTQRTAGLTFWVAKVAESVGILNKGSAAAPAAPAPDEDDKTQAISTNSLNVTRVSGIAALIATAGAASVALFGVDRDTDAAAVVAAAYASTGLIVAAALFTVAIVIAADIRQRGVIAAAPVTAESTPEVIEVGPPRDGEVSLGAAHELVLLDASRGDLHVSLPRAEDAAWKLMALMRTDGAGSNTVSVRDPNGDDALAHLDIDGGLVELYSNGSTWKRCERNGAGQATDLAARRQ